MAPANPTPKPAHVGGHLTPSQPIHPIVTTKTAKALVGKLMSTTDGAEQLGKLIRKYA